MATSTGPTEKPKTTDGRRLLAGRYQVGSLIGRGGMADVHLGTDTRLGRTVAIKLLRSSLASDPAFRVRFRQEAQSAARMAHPTIVRVFDAGEEIVLDERGVETQVPFIVMEYVDGKMVKDIISMGPLEPAEATHIVEGILTALEYSHRAGVVHRDIKPGNIMITRNGQVKVMDFGIARAISDSSATVAQTTAILGTAQYFSPEQARGESVDARTDLYSTGIVLFEMLTGRAPFRGDTAVAVAYQHVSEQPPVPSSINPKISPALDAVVLRALTKDRNERYQSAAEFRDDVQTAASGRIPQKKLPEPDFGATLFGAAPSDTLGASTAMKQLAADDYTIVRTQNRPPAVWIWSGILAVIVIVAAVVFWVVSLSPTQQVVDVAREVPDLTGATYDSAAEALRDLDLVVSQHTETSPTIAEGQVIRTDPPAGTRLAQGDSVDVYVSSGIAQAAVPDVENTGLAGAQEALTAQGFTVGSITRQHSPTYANDVVISSDPPAGTQLGEGSTVNLIVSDGVVELPDVRNLTIAEARGILEGPELGLRVTIGRTGGCGPQSDIVVTQSMPPGTVPQGSEIVIDYCDGT
ncbi:Stk1 family PASTA domain-containing Ser/Thr kinase [Herbiconiux sp. L3-i23]|uniref:Stk1 family PASTA domain-containing Ser/Thr kinase n=1 Tax=Herbiconiux sp. L3-i23 TaxID=2905871 RepID=UPI00206B7425|nr:Stk1 family PASTA domain-containing Ser/Thr kinase [Herbiconiux sp. L3-i23]BDI21241.1 putative serine/threonine-protein kinase PknB [Herbiconiux sp. L3-i23]